MTKSDVPERTSATAARSRRSARAHEAILTATSEMLADAGYGALTIEGVAARARLKAGAANFQVSWVRAEGEVITRSGTRAWDAI